MECKKKGQENKIRFQKPKNPLYTTFAIENGTSITAFGADRRLSVKIVLSNFQT